jgi:tetratricopeptide (TPR) repeat protein
MQGRMEALDKAITRDPANAEAWYLRGLAHIDQWKPTLPAGVAKRILERAANDLSYALNLNPQHYVYATALTDVNDRLGNEAAGLAAAQQAMRVAPLNEEARLALALHYHRWGHFEDAERAYRAAQSAGQRNKDGEFGWNDGYQQLLKDMAAAKAVQPK